MVGKRVSKGLSFIVPQHDDQGRQFRSEIGTKMTYFTPSFLPYSFSAMKIVYQFAAVAIALGALNTTNVFAQEVYYCGFDWALQKLAQQHSGFEASCTEVHNRTMAEASSLRANRATVYQIPVVFHVVWNTESQNLPDSVILDQMAILNQDYRRLNPNAVETRDIFLDIAADAEIEFVLATQDPFGNPTNGINRVETTRNGFEFNIFSQDITVDEVKFTDTGGADAWDTQNYLNIWVCNITAGFGLQPFGFAYPPNGAPNWEGTFTFIPDNVQGVVVHYTAVGSNSSVGLEDNFPGNEGGRTLTHEVGHYLGLRHTWGDAFFNGCSADDGIADTPNIATNNNFACNFNANTCNDGEGDLPDMGENFMDYNQDDCVNMFTLGQVDAMRYVLEELRPDLIDGQVGVASRSKSEWQLFPNPASSSVSIHAERVSEVIVYDLRGKAIETLRLNPGLNQVQVSHWSPGVYLLHDQRAGRSTRLMIAE